MFSSRWLLFMVYPYAVGATECLVGCLVQGLNPFDDGSITGWDDRGACDSSTAGCTVSAINYPSASYQGALWSSTSGPEGSSDCTCNVCDPQPWGDATSYMSEEKSLWSRIHCYLAASEASGYDVSPCVAAILDSETLLCVDDVFEPPTVGLLDCDENAIQDLDDLSPYDQCNWDGDARMAQELFSTTRVLTSTTSTGIAVRTDSCLVGCMIQGVDPFDDDGLAVWDNRDTCNSNTIGCAVSAINYPSTYYGGILWASSSGTDGSSSCTCSICDPYDWGSVTSYMSTTKSVWSRIHCYLATVEAVGYDVSPCVAAIVDTGTLPCVDDVYEPPTVDQFDCEVNGILELTDSSTWEQCNWDGDVRMADELFATTVTSSSSTADNVGVNSSSCLVGCLVQGIDPFDDDGLAVWDNRDTCNSNTIGCAVSAINYPSTYYGGILWASSSGTDGSSSCTCSICDPHDWGSVTSYMSTTKSVWSRIHCYLATVEAVGYDVSPCVAAIVDTGTLPCVDDVYEPPTVDQFDCEVNGISELTDSSTWEQCNWDGDVRMVEELFATTVKSSSSTAGNVPVNTTSCLVGCLVQGIDPFDDDGLAVWGNRDTCNSNTIGCAVSAINYPSTYYGGALWASISGTDGSSSCTCSICDPHDSWSVSSYMSTTKSVWSRIHCYIAAAEAAGYDVSPCVAAIVDTETLPCVDDMYEPPTVDQFGCQLNGISELTDSSTWQQCNWDGEFRMAEELFSTTVTSSSSTAGNVAVNTTSCLVGCLVQGIDPFDDDGLAVWDNRDTCNSNTIGCAVSAINYPSSSYDGALWASSSGTDGSSSCTCSICDPHDSWSVSSYMSTEKSLWSRIHCYLATAEAAGYDVSPCVTAIIDTGTLPCVDDIYEQPTVDQFDCEKNGISELTDSSTWEQCTWTGVARWTDELYGGTQAPSPLPGPTITPVSSNPREVAPETGINLTDSPNSIPAVPSGTTPPAVGASTPPVEVEGVSCGVGNTCQDDLCCHPDTSTCGRKYTFCQQRDFSEGPRCCSGVDGDPSALNVCSEDSICDEPDKLTRAEEAGMWIGICTGIIGITVGFWKAYAWCKGGRKDKDLNSQQQQQQQHAY